MPDQPLQPPAPDVGLPTQSRTSYRRRVLIVVEHVAGVLLMVAGVPLVLYAALLTMRAGTPEQQQWYETTALVPFVSGAFMLAGGGWLIRDARGQEEGLKWYERRLRDRARNLQR